VDLATGRLPERAEGYSPDLDSTVFERYGEQEGVKRGYNPRKPGRGSHHPLLAVLGEAYFILHGWLRSGNTQSGRGAVEFLKEALAKLETLEWIRVVRADAGFFDQELLQYLEETGLSYIVVARLSYGFSILASGTHTYTLEALPSEPNCSSRHDLPTRETVILHGSASGISNKE